MTAPLQDLANTVAWGTGATAFGSFLLALSERRPWRPGRFERMLSRHYQRRLDKSAHLSPAQRRTRQDEIDRFLTEPPLPRREFGDQLWHHFTWAFFPMLGAALISFFFKFDF